MKTKFLLNILWSRQFLTTTDRAALMYTVILLLYVQTEKRLDNYRSFCTSMISLCFMKWPHSLHKEI